MEWFRPWLFIVCKQIFSNIYYHGKDVRWLYIPMYPENLPGRLGRHPQIGRYLGIGASKSIFSCELLYPLGSHLCAYAERSTRVRRPVISFPSCADNIPTQKAMSNRNSRTNPQSPILKSNPSGAFWKGKWILGLVNPSGHIVIPSLLTTNWLRLGGSRDAFRGYLCPWLLTRFDLT